MHRAVVPPSSRISQLRRLIPASRGRADATEPLCILVQRFTPAPPARSAELQQSLHAGRDFQQPSSCLLRWKSQEMPSWEEKEEKLEVTGAAAAKVEEMRGPGCALSIIQRDILRVSPIQGGCSLSIPLHRPPPLSPRLDLAAKLQAYRSRQQ